MAGALLSKFCTRCRTKNKHKNKKITAVMAENWPELPCLKFCTSCGSTAPLPAADAAIYTKNTAKKTEKKKN